MKKFSLFIRFPQLHDFHARSTLQQLNFQRAYLLNITRELRSRLREKPWSGLKLSRVSLCGASWWSAFPGFLEEFFELLQSMNLLTTVRQVEYRVSPQHISYLLSHSFPAPALIYLKAVSFCQNTLRELEQGHSAQDSILALHQLERDSHRFALEMRIDARNQSSQSFQQDLLLSFMSSAEQIVFKSLQENRQICEPLILRKRRPLLALAHSAGFTEHQFEYFAKEQRSPVRTQARLGVGAAASSLYPSDNQSLTASQNVVDPVRYIECTANGTRALESCKILEKYEQINLHVQETLISGACLVLKDLQELKLPATFFLLTLPVLLEAGFLKRSETGYLLTTSGFLQFEKILRMLSFSGNSLYQNQNLKEPPLVQQNISSGAVLQNMPMESQNSSAHAVLFPT